MLVFLPELAVLDVGEMGKGTTVVYGPIVSSEAVANLESSTPPFDPVVGGPPASFGAQVAISALIAILGVWSALGNLLTILAILANRYMRTKCNYFILSLAVSDLISGMVASPLWLYRRTWGFQDWSWGDFLCKLFWFVDESTSYCTAMHIASFAVWRYIGVRWPHAIDKFPKSKVKIWLCSIWVVAIIFGGAVFSTFYAVHDRLHTHLRDDYAQWPSCTIKITDNGVKKHLIYYTFSSATFMLLPMLILFASSVLICRELFFHAQIKSTLRKIKERKAVCQLALISGSFLLGYVPMTAYVMWTTRTPHSEQRVDYWTHIAAYFTLRISECLNPIIYNIASENMRKASRKILHWIGNCCRSDTEIDFVMNSPSCRRHSLFSPHSFLRIHRDSANSQDGKSKQRCTQSLPRKGAKLFKFHRFHRNSSTSSTMLTTIQTPKSASRPPTLEFGRPPHSLVAEESSIEECTQMQLSEDATNRPTVDFRLGTAALSPTNEGVRLWRNRPRHYREEERREGGLDDSIS